MNITTLPFPTPRTATAPGVVGREQETYRSNVQTIQENVTKTRVYQVTSDSATQGDVNIVTPFAVVLGGFAKRSDGVFLPVTILPLAGTPSTAVLSGFPISTIAIISIYGR